MTNIYICKHCNREIQDQLFNKVKSWCKECLNEYHKIWYSKNKERVSKERVEKRNKNKEEANQHRREYYQQNKEQILENNKKSRRKNKDKISLKRKQYYDKHKEEVSRKNKEKYKRRRGKIIKKASEYYIKNKETILAYRKTPSGKYVSYKTKSKKSGRIFSLTKEGFVSLVEAKCIYCGKKPAGGVDRKDSSLGYTLSNAVACCETCNRIKLDYHIIDFFEQIKRILKTRMPEQFGFLITTKRKGVFGSQTVCSERRAGKIPGGPVNFKRKFREYRDRAKDRNIEFDLNYQEFLSFSSILCRYCGEEICGVGIDRIDSDEGYSLLNCVPCCRMCNEMKLNYKLSDWLVHLKQIFFTALLA